MRDNQQILAAMGDRARGVEPPAAPPPDTAATATPPQPAPAPAQPAPEKPTAAEQANAAAAPKTEGDAQSSAPYKVKVKVGGEERELNESQIAGVYNRYRDLNRKHAEEVAPLEDVLSVAREIQNAAKQAGHDLDGRKVAELMMRSVRQMVQNPQMGAEKHPNRRDENLPADDEMRRWEDENGVTLPPGFRDMNRNMQQLMMQNQQLAGALREVLQRAGTVNDGAKQLATQATQQAASAAQQRVVNNLERAQRQYGLPDEDEEAFWMFASERGYVPEDFIDARLTNNVVQDFVNSKQSGELNRLREVAQRRMAFTGSPGGAAGSGQPNAASPNQAFIERLGQKARAQ